MKVEAKLEELGFVLPDSMKLPPNVEIPFAWVRVYRDRAFISGHGALNPDGAVAGPFGRVGAEVSREEALEAARLTTLAMLAHQAHTRRLRQSGGLVDGVGNDQCCARLYSDHGSH